MQVSQHRNSNKIHSRIQCVKWINWCVRAYHCQGKQGQMSQTSNANSQQEEQCMNSNRIIQSSSLTFFLDLFIVTKAILMYIIKVRQEIIMKGIRMVLLYISCLKTMCHKQKLNPIPLFRKIKSKVSFTIIKLQVTNAVIFADLMVSLPLIYNGKLTDRNLSRAMIKIWLIFPQNDKIPKIDKI